MSENYWKDAYKDTWGASSSREKRLASYIEKLTGRSVSESGLGAGTDKYISGSASRNGYQKGDADLFVEGTNIYIEVTGPLSTAVQSSQPLWFRPDKVNNAIRNSMHDTFWVHNCASDDTWRVIHIDKDFINRFRNYEFPVVTPVIRGRRERYIEIQTTDRSIKNIQYLVEYIKRLKG